MHNPLFLQMKRSPNWVALASALGCFLSWADGMAVHVSTISQRPSSVIVVSHPPIERVRPPAWTAWLPPFLSDDQMDVRIQWETSTCDAVRRERTEAAAASMVQQANRWKQHCRRSGVGCFDTTNGGIGDDDVFLEELGQSFRTFEDFCRRYLDPARTCRARLVASRGRQSTKCPQWHTDYVPVRWIQALVGPGCVWAEYANGSPEASARQAATGTAVLLPGRYWNDYFLHSTCNEATVVSASAVRHKSPELSFPWQGRILLTIDVDLGATDD